VVAASPEYRKRARVPRNSNGSPTPADGVATIESVPIYEFLCERCEGRFEELADPGVETVACRICGAPRTRKVYSAPSAPFKIVKAAGETRKRERRNEVLRRRTKERVRRARRGLGRASGEGP
jgi:putative FmdB family regulatory protein